MVLQAHGAPEILHVMCGGDARCFLCLRIAVTHLTLVPDPGRPPGHLR